MLLGSNLRKKIYLFFLQYTQKILNFTSQNYKLGNNTELMSPNFLS